MLYITKTITGYYAVTFSVWLSSYISFKALNKEVSIKMHDQNPLLRKSDWKPGKESN
jgi:hypothetical protein